MEMIQNPHIPSAPLTPPPLRHKTVMVSPSAIPMYQMLFMERCL